jgi:hypothetical protein
MNAIKVIVILALLCLIVLALALSVVGNHAVDALAEQARQPDSATDLIFRSRQLAPADPITRRQSGWLGAGLLALFLVLLGAMLFLMQGGSEFLRQWRLTRKRPSSHTRRYPPDTHPNAVHWTELPHVPTVRYLPEVDDEQMVDPRH